MILAIDLETSGLEWSSDILTIGAAWRDGEAIQKKAWTVGMTDLFHTPIPPPQVMHELGLLVDKAEWVAMHNASFDLSYLFRDKYISPQQVKRKIFCTYLTARMTGPRPKLSLDALCREYGITDPRWASMKNQRKNLSRLAVESVLEYNEQDATYTLMLAERLWKESLALYGEEFTRKESDFCRVMAEIRVRGKKLHRESTQRKRDSSVELRRKLLHNVLWPRQIESPNDRQGLIKYLRLQGVSDFLLTEKGNEQLDKFGLEHLNQDVYGEDVTKTIWAIQELRGLEKLIGTYLTPLLDEHSDANDIVHPSYSVGGTVTYRLSSSHPNGQNFPRELDDVVWQPYLQADYSQAELRIAAMASQETNLAKAFAKDADVHTETAMLMFNATNDVLRKRAKNMNFASIYFAGPKTVSERYDVEFDEALGLLRLHRKIYPHLHKTARKMIDVWKERGYLILISGKRLYATPDDLLRSYKAFNNAVQGSVGELVKDAMLEMDERGITMIGQKHDSIDFPLGTDMEEVKEIMQDVLPEEFSTRVKPPVKMRADVEMKGYKENEQ